MSDGNAGPEASRPTIRTKNDPRTHAAMDTGFQLLTLCGRRGTWRAGDQYDKGTGVVDCAECLEILAESNTGNKSL